MRNSTIISLAALMLLLLVGRAWAQTPPPVDLAAGATVLQESGDWGTQHGDANATQFVAQNAVDNNVTEPPFGGESGSGEHEWLGREGVLGENFTIDLGASDTLTEIDLYNTHNGTFNDRGTIDFHIVGGNAVDGSDNVLGSTILTGVLSDTSGEAVIIPDKFTGNFGSVRYLQFYADTAKNNDAGLNEIAVYSPEPASVSLLCVGAAGLVLRRRR